MSASSLRAGESNSRRSGDSMTWYLASIGREPLLTPAEEIELGNQVQTMMALVEVAREDYSQQELKSIRIVAALKQE